MPKLEVGNLGWRHRILEPLGAPIRRIGLFDPPTLKVGRPEGEQHIECRHTVGDGPAVSGDLEQASRIFEVRGCPERIRCVDSAFSRHDQHAGRQRPASDPPTTRTWSALSRGSTPSSLANISANTTCSAAGAQLSSHSLADDRHAHPQPLAAHHHQPDLEQLGKGDVEARTTGIRIPRPKRLDGRDASRRTTDRDYVEKSSSSGRQVTQQIVDGDAHRRGKAHPAARRGRELQYPRRLFTVAPPVARQASDDANASCGSSGATSTTRLGSARTPPGPHTTTVPPPATRSAVHRGGYTLHHRLPSNRATRVLLASPTK
jgi:hypothetical protein